MLCAGGKRGSNRKAYGTGGRAEVVGRLLLDRSCQLRGLAKDSQASLAASAGGLYIGAGSTLAPGAFWKGLIDDVRIYDRAVKP